MELHQVFFFEKYCTAQCADLENLVLYIPHYVHIVLFPCFSSTILSGE
uniref:Uncharacterized protein n=1 Tax=Arundo donax TaxID=35708 RepID=A0A0A9GJ98_ARUDO